jgi:hypothetical protein
MQRGRKAVAPQRTHQHVPARQWLPAMHAGQPTEFRFEFDRSTDRIQGGAALKSK